MFVFGVFTEKLQSECGKIGRKTLNMNMKAIKRILTIKSCSGNFGEF